MKNKDKDIWDRLKEKDNPFSVPNGYFDALEDKLRIISEDISGNEDNDTTNLTKSSEPDSILKDHKKIKSGFTVPDGYFDSLEPEGLEKKSNHVIALNSKISRIVSLSIAASILLFFGIQYNNGLNAVSNEFTLHEDEISDWVEMDLVSFNSYEIAEVFSDVELEEITYSEEELYDYLNEVDIENIILEN